MNTHKKIDLYFNGDYWRSTNQAKTPKQAKQQALQSLGLYAHTTTGAGRVGDRILKRPDLLKAYFDKNAAK